jgi:hypothetical protein
MKEYGIEIENRIGKWYVIDEKFFKGEKIYLLEHETYGDEAGCLIVNENLQILLDEVYNGFNDLDLIR